MASDSIVALDRLSPQELRCLQIAAEHKRTKEIAAETGLSPATVDTYISRAVRKLGFTSRPQAIRALAAHQAALDPGSVSGKPGSSFPDVDAAAPAVPAGQWKRLPWPFPTRARPTNSMSPGETIVAIVAAASIMLIVALAYLLAMSLVSNARWAAAAKQGTTANERHAH